MNRLRLSRLSRAFAAACRHSARRVGRWAARLASPAVSAADSMAELFDGRLPNNFPFLNGAGTAATYSTAGFVDLTNPFHVPQGTNGRSCESCHLPQVGWSIRPIDVELKFLLPRATIRSSMRSTPTVPRRTCPRCRQSARPTACCARGCSAAAAPVPATSEYEIVAFDDPLRRRRDADAVPVLPPTARDRELSHREERRLARPEHERQR